MITTIKTFKSQILRMKKVWTNNWDVLILNTHSSSLSSLFIAQNNPYNDLQIVSALYDSHLSKLHIILMIFHWFPRMIHLEPSSGSACTYWGQALQV